MHILKFPKNCIIGKNNYIQSGVKLFDNIVIGNNNKIYDGTVIYPNTKIGNNNVILNNNILGEYPISSNDDYNFIDKKFNGLEIGNNNFFHISNKIYSGFENKTKIGDFNKILGESHIGHDCEIYSNVNIYTRGMLCGYVKMLNHSGIGAGAVIHQRKILGDYSFIGMNNTITKNCFPFYINLNNNYNKFNYLRINLNLNNFDLYEDKISTILNEYKNSNNNINFNNYKKELSPEIFEIISNFLSHK